MNVQQGVMSEKTLADAFDLEFILVAGGIENTANEAAARSLSRIWSGEFAMLCKVATGGDPSQPAIGKTVLWSEESAMDGDRPGVIIEQYREERRRGDAIRARTDDEIKIDFSVAGHLLSNISA